MVWATCSDDVQMLNRTAVLLNNEQADAKTLSLLLFCKYVYIRKQKSGNKVVQSCFCAGDHDRWYSILSDRCKEWTTTNSLGYQANQAN